LILNAGFSCIFDATSGQRTAYCSEPTLDQIYSVCELNCKLQ